MNTMTSLISLHNCHTHMAARPIKPSPADMVLRGRAGGVTAERGRVPSSDTRQNRDADLMKLLLLSLPLALHQRERKHPHTPQRKS